MDARILIVEDDEDINNLLKAILLRRGYETVQAFSGSEARMILDRENFDLILLDLMLPAISGEDLVEEIRKDNIVPIIIISAKLDIETKVKLLELGADDFISKPFDKSELIARVESQLRRYLEFASEGKKSLDYKNLTIEEDERAIRVKGEELKLTVKEYDILLLLLKHPKKVFTKENIYRSVWGDDYYMDDNTLNVHISNIRNKIAEKDEDEEYIETVWGIGFKLKS